MDATRRHDDKHVMLKKIYPDEGPHELQITRLFSSWELSRDPRNHCVPLLDIIEIPHNGQKLMVMPLLRPFNDPHFQTFGEFVAFFTQICEVRPSFPPTSRTNSDRPLWIRVFNSCRSGTSHTGTRVCLQPEMGSETRPFRDCTVNHIMFGSSDMYPQGFHPAQMNRSRDFKGRAKRYTRTQKPPRYYLIDFGLSRRYRSRNALDVPLRGGDKSAPEHQNVAWCNPFYTDIYYLGNLVRQEFILVSGGRLPCLIILMDCVTRSTMVSGLCKTWLTR